jgi:hypothetical protein
MSDEGEHFDEEPDVDMLKVSEQGLPSTILQSYLTFLQKLFTTAEQTFLVEKKGKEDMVLADVQASSLMEDKRNQLVLNQSKFDSLLLASKQKQAKANLNASYVQTLNAKRHHWVL